MVGKARQQQKMTDLQKVNFILETFVFILMHQYIVFTFTPQFGTVVIHELYDLNIKTEKKSYVTVTVCFTRRASSLNLDLPSSLMAHQ
jgi:hypothetical protein